MSKQSALHLSGYISNSFLFPAYFLNLEYYGTQCSRKVLDNKNWLHSNFIV